MSAAPIPYGQRLGVMVDHIATRTKVRPSDVEDDLGWDKRSTEHLFRLALAKCLVRRVSHGVYVRTRVHAPVTRAQQLTRLASERGTFTVAMACEATRATPRSVRESSRRLIRAGLLERVKPGVYRLAGAGE